MANVRISESAAKKLNNLPTDVRDRIKQKLLNDVAANPGRYCKPLTGSNEHRVRVGDYRVVLDWDKANSTLRITDVDKRDRIYDRR